MAYPCILLVLSLLMVNIALWVITVLVLKEFPAVVSTVALAYTLGLRHAVDADHICAIDNVTRRLIQLDQKPITVGFYFSLGHSTVVFAATVAVMAAVNSIETELESFQEIGSIIGTSVSVSFLLLIAGINGFALYGTYGALERLANSGEYEEIDMNEYLENAGCLGKCLKPLFSAVNAPWKMYPLGLLFGLGFDTSIEVTFLAISATQTAPLYSLILLPLMFAAGMCIIDTLDGILMLGAYGFASVNPIKKLLYNMFVTLFSVLFAMMIAFVQLFSLIGSQMEDRTPFWAFFVSAGEHLETIGYIVIATFMFSWFVAYVVYKRQGFKELADDFDKRTAIMDGSACDETTVANL